MKRPKLLGCLSALCLLAIAALGAQSAAAQTTVFTCKEVATGAVFSDAHCTSSSGTLHYAHVSFLEDLETEAMYSNAQTCEETKKACPLILKSIVSGKTITIEAKKVTGPGTIVNEIISGEMRARSRGIWTLEELSVAVTGAKECAVAGGKITTTEIGGTTAGTGAAVKIEPRAGVVFASFKVEGCTVAAANKEYKLEGSFKATPHGATTEFGHGATTEQNTLTLGGQKAGVEGKLTFAGRTVGIFGPYTPIAYTEVP